MTQASQPPLKPAASRPRRSGAQRPVAQPPEGTEAVVQSDNHQPLVRGEIVVFRTPPRTREACAESGTFVKRIIGMPGETISEEDGTVYVNGRRLSGAQPYEVFTSVIDEELSRTGAR